MAIFQHCSHVLWPWWKVSMLGWLRRSSLKQIHSSRYQMLVSNIQGTGHTEALHSQGCNRSRRGGRSLGRGREAVAALNRMVLDKPKLPQTRGETRQQPATELLGCPEQIACCLWASSITLRFTPVFPRSLLDLCFRIQRFSKTSKRK